MPRQDNLKKLIAKHSRRLQKLKEQQALKGLDTAPHILIEIEDIEAEIEKLQKELESLGDSSVDRKSQRPEVGRLGSQDQIEDLEQKPQQLEGELRQLAEPTESVDTAKEAQRTSNNLPVDFVIVTALEEERNAVLDKLPGHQRLGPSEDDIRTYFSANLPVTFPDGSTGTYNVVVMPLLGMGRVQATTATNDAIRRWKPRYVILVGIAGGVAENGVKLGDVLVSNQIADYELQRQSDAAPEIRWQVYKVSQRLLSAAQNFMDESWTDLISANRPYRRGRPKRYIGPIASGDKVIDSAETLEKFLKIWPKLIGVEMEAGGVALSVLQAENQARFFMIRGVSDLADGKKKDPKVKNWRPYACDVAASYTIALLQSGPVVLSSNEQPPLPPEREGMEEKKSSPVEDQPSSNLDLESPYGTMHPDSKFYIERAADDECWQHISQTKAVTLFIKAPRQVGKSSLIYRMLDRAKKKLNKRSAFIDFQKLPKQHFADEESFLVEFCLMISEELGIPEDVDHYWKGRRTNIRKCSGYVSEYIIPKIDASFILAMDEIEGMASSPFRANFFGMLRTWHNARAGNENFARMTLFLSSAIEPDLLIDNLNQSPFNVAELISLPDFTMAEVEDLNRRHQSPLSPTEVSDLINLVGGHPFLVRLALYQLAGRKIDMSTLLAQATDDSGPFGNHLRHYLLRVLEKPELREALAHICRHQAHEENQILYRLEGTGLIKKIGQQVVLRNNLYARYFDTHLNHQ